MRALRLSDLAEAVFLFVGFEVFPGCFHLLMVGDAEAVVIVETLFRRVRSPFMYDQAPLRVGVLECGYARRPLDDLHGQQIGEDRQSFRKGAALVMAGDKTGGLQDRHLFLLSGQLIAVERGTKYQPAAAGAMPSESRAVGFSSSGKQWTLLPVLRYGSGDKKLV